MPYDRAALRLPSHLFTVRVWREELEEGRFEWRGKVQYALSGEMRYFRQWEDLIEFMREKSEGTSAPLEPGS